jgi:two-component system nitrogen regulation sensor histidine kinase GlnL
MNAKRSKQENSTEKSKLPEGDMLALSALLYKQKKKPLREMLKIVKTSLDADAVTIFLPNEKQKRLSPFLTAARQEKKSKNPQGDFLDLAEQVYGAGKPSMQKNNMASPLTFTGKTVAVLALQRSEKEDYKKTDLKLLKSFSASIDSLIAMALEAHSAQQLATIDAMLDKLSKHLEATDTIDRQAQKASDFFQKHFSDLLFGLFIVIDEKLLQFKSGNEWGIKKGTGLKFSKNGIIGWAAMTKEPLLIDDVAADKRKVEGNRDIKSIFAIPLLRGNSIFGVIAFGSKKQRKWQPDLVTTLQKISNIIAMKICNAVSFNELEYYSKKIENLNKFVNSVIKGFPSGIITIDKWGNITLINEKAQEVFGFSENDAKRITIKELFQRKQATINPFLTTLTENKPLTRIETTIVESNGKKVPIGFSTSLLRDEHGNAIGAIGIMKELTKIKEEEEGLRREDRLVALGEMAAGMAHEIRNPLAGIRTGVEYLGRFLDDDKKNAVTMIVREIKRLNRIVTDMTSYANRPPIKLDKTSLAEIINISLGFLKNEMEEKNIEIIKGYDVTVPSIFLDSDQIREVFDNILMNALQATEKNGKIIITTGTDESGNNVEVRITDNGCGISEQDRERIFNPFFTTKKGGTGLGLSICYRIISEHNGYIVISSKEGKGTTVKVVLPKNAEPQRST